MMPRLPILAGRLLAALIVSITLGSDLDGAFKNQATQPAVPDDWRTKREQVVIRGEVAAGQRFTQRFGPDFAFELRPTQDNWNTFIGWSIHVVQRGRPQNLAGLSTHWSGSSPVDVMGWHFLPHASTAREYRDLVFSPEVGRTIPLGLLSSSGNRSRAEIEQQVDRIGRFGQAGLSLWDIQIKTMGENAEVVISSMKFEAELTWPASYQPQ